MPTAAHYKCVKCHQLTTHEIVHVSEELKHDAHLVKVFTARSISVLKKNNVDIHKIIQFTDQAPSQYKNKQPSIIYVITRYQSRRILWG